MVDSSEASQAKGVDVVRAILADIIGVMPTDIEPAQSFLELGCDSLALARLATRLRDICGVELVLPEIFFHPTLADLGAFLDDAGRAGARKVFAMDPPLCAVERGERIGLSLAQQRLWFLTQLESQASRAYHIPVGLRLQGRLDTGALRQALNRLVARHESLRTRFIAVEGLPWQQIDAAGIGFELQEQDLTREVQGPALHDLTREEQREAQLQEIAAEEGAREFDLSRGPLIRGRLLRREPDDHVLLLTMHHIIADGWSIGILLKELAQLYGAYAQGATDPLTPLSVQYADYAQWQRQWLEGERIHRQAQYWQQQLAGAPQLLTLPGDHARPAQQSYAGGVLDVQLDEELVRGLKDLGQRQGTTLFMTVLAGWAAVLSRLSGQSEVMIGTPTANRPRTEIEGLIGFFVNTLAIRVDLSESPNGAQLLAQVRQRVLGAQANQDIPFEQVVELVKPERTLAYSPLFQVMLAWQNLPQEQAPWRDLGVTGLQMGQVAAQFDLSLSLQESHGQIGGTLVYARELFEAATVARYVGYWQRVLRGMVADERCAVQALPMLPEAEWDQVVRQWNRTQVA